MCYLKAFIFLGIVCFAFEVAGQNLPVTHRVRSVENQQKNASVLSFKTYPQEKVFVHTNQPVYSNGETIWYKVYTMAYGKPSALSKIVYLQLSDTAGNVITQNKQPLINSFAHGNIDIGQKIKSGWYELSAFTSWMMNFGPQAYYHQRIYIRNVEDQVAAPAKTAIVKKIYHATFYPEGGDLIDGNLSKIAFRICDDRGVAVTATGIVKDNTNKAVAEFNTGHDGMGEFAIDASSESTYTATVKFPDGSNQQVSLPKVKDAGLHLKVSQNADVVELKLAFAGQEEGGADFFMMASQSSGKVLTVPLALNKGINTFELHKAVLNTGILRLTIFDYRGVPQAERIVFINKHDLWPPTLKTDTLAISAKGLNSFSLNIKDKAGMPVMGNFSVAVTDGVAFDGNNATQNIFSSLLLSPELKGEVSNPAYYFTNESDSLANQLDLVMLTNGWRHFVPVNTALTYPVEQSQYIAGNVTNLKGRQVPKVKILITSPDSTKFIGYITPDNTGRFIINDFNHSGSSDILLQTADIKSHTKKFAVKLFTTLADSIKQAKALPFNVQPVINLSGYYLAAAETEEKNRIRINGILLKEVKINSLKITPLDQVINDHVSVKYHSDREFNFDLVNNPTTVNYIAEYLQGRIAGLQVFVGENGAATFIYRGGGTLMDKGKGSKATLPPEPYCYFNEVQVDFSAIQYIPPEDIALIRFIPPPVYFAPYNGGVVGALMIYTKSPSDEAKKMTGMDDFDHFTYNGYTVTREFSNADYRKAGVYGAPDNRTTLYWNHDINTDNTGNLKFRFYNSDKARQFKITLQGMDADGRLVYFEKTVQ